MVKHQPLQYYEPQLCLSCLTGIYGCRWKRYQRSHDDTTKWDRMWFLILSSTFFLTLTWFYFWWEVHNDYDEFNWLLYNRMEYWSDWSIPILALTAAGFTYIAVLLVLALCHIAVGQQMYLHWLHKMGVTVILVATMVAMISIEQLWDEEWDTLLLSFQATAPFLHIGAVAAVTMLAWMIAGQFARAEKVFFQIFILIAYIAIVVALYLVPLTISSPCIMKKKDLSPRPAIIGHRGAPMLAPENTVMSFQKAIEQHVSGLQADVAVSQDGVPFLMHDETLRRTTNVKEVFPERALEYSYTFNWTDLEKLNAGRWFLQSDPFWTADSLSPLDSIAVQNQSICKLAELLRLAKEHNKSAILNILLPPADHPHRSGYINITLDTILKSGIPQGLVMWLLEEDRQLVKQIAPGFQQISDVMGDIETLRQKGIVKLNLRYNQISTEEIREFTAWNLSTNLYTVNEPWLYSVLWCAGVQSVTSDASHLLNKVLSPVWLMSPEEYYLIWITSDVISFTIILGVFILQKWRLGSIRTYNPEQIMLSAAVRRSSRDVKIMKEKLIFAEINNGVGSAEELSLCSENGYDGYANDAITPMDHQDIKIHLD
ncbi:glycerophosphodiester phosphodiesterase domain-containing protein 5 isoform X2 [Latimeria chalumnae]|uniref:glycerophosphodiester phosphodiesterase domain-containing protein 5 isoform X2 n=1 Tax=Latimeria chalumnae TaxID=7897 RepID=UPI00313D412A